MVSFFNSRVTTPWMKSQRTMKPNSHTLSTLGSALFLALSLSARAEIFTNNTVIQSFDGSYEGAEIVVSNCTLTVNGPHSFSNVLVGAGGTLTHTFSGSSILNVSRSFTDEVQVLNGTNAVSLINTGALVSASVTDVGKTVTYTNDVDYALGFPGFGVIQLQRTTNSTIPDGASVLVNYTVNVSTLSGLNLNVTGNVQVAVGGVINVNGRGWAGNLGTGAGGETSPPPVSGGGAGYGGYGGMSSSNALGGTTYGSVAAPIDLGSGGGLGSTGGAGGAGGGAVKIVATGDLILDGLISANGADATNNRSGGGSGGSIWLSAKTITGTGVLAANGGAGEPIHGGGGGGGRIALQADTNNFATSSITVYGGVGAKNGGAGTIYTKLTGKNAGVLVDNGGMTATNTPVLLFSGEDLTVRGRSVVVSSSSGLTIGKLFVGSNSVVTMTGPNTALQISTTGDVTVEPSGRITLDGLNASTGTGAGLGTSVGSGVYICGGGGHGGYGGSASAIARGGSAYGSSTSPHRRSTDSQRQHFFRRQSWHGLVRRRWRRRQRVAFARNVDRNRNHIGQWRSWNSSRRRWRQWRSNFNFVQYQFILRIDHGIRWHRNQQRWRRNDLSQNKRPELCATDHRQRRQLWNEHHIRHGLV
jgi:hypothetical protein